MSDTSAWIDRPVVNECLRFAQCYRFWMIAIVLSGSKRLSRCPSLSIWKFSGDVSESDLQQYQSSAVADGRHDVGSIYVMFLWTPLLAPAFFL
jgi:hypothetical protein